jgi:hypothetical protein
MDIPINGIQISKYIGFIEYVHQPRYGVHQKIDKKGNEMNKISFDEVFPRKKYRLKIEVHYRGKYKPRTIFKNEGDSVQIP